MADDQDLKDILVDGDSLAPDVKQHIANATAKLKDELTRREREAAELKGQYDKVAKYAADRDYDAQKATADLHGLAGYAVRTEHAALASAIAATDAEATQLQNDLATAIETADGKRAAELQRKLAAAEARRITLEQGRDTVAAEMKRAEAAPAPPQPKRVAPQTGGDTYEQMIAPLPELQKQWMRQNKDKNLLGPTGQPTDALVAAFHAARAAGFREDAPAFFTHMERVLGAMNQPRAQAQQQVQDGDAAERFNEPTQAQPAPQQQQRRPIPAAPPSRGGNGQGTPTKANGNGPRVALSQAEKYTAARLGMTEAEYAAGIAEGVKRGKYPQSRLMQ